MIKISSEHYTKGFLRSTSIESNIFIFCLFNWENKIVDQDDQEDFFLLSIMF